MTHAPRIQRAVVAGYLAGVQVRHIGAGRVGEAVVVRIIGRAADQIGALSAAYMQAVRPFRVGCLTYPRRGARHD